MNLRRATVADLMDMQNCNLHNLPEVRRESAVRWCSADPPSCFPQNYQMKYCAFEPWSTVSTSARD